MGDHAEKLRLWDEILAMYEECDPDWNFSSSDWNWYAKNAELVHELLKCRGIEQLRPWTSLFRFRMSVPEIAGVSHSLGVAISRSGEYHVWARRESRSPSHHLVWKVFFERRCPHLRSAIRAVRVAARLCGVKISQPRREQPPPGAMRRTWLVISKDGLFAPPRARYVYRELRLDGFAFGE
jgi:hypothetical protein